MLTSFYLLQIKSNLLASRYICVKFFMFFELILKYNRQIVIIIKLMHEYGKLPLVGIIYLTLKGLNFGLDEKHEKIFILRYCFNDVILFNFVPKAVIP